MEQHQIPQPVTSYQFRLVGDMTLKQFLQLAGGFLVALIFYASGLHPIIKWPLIFLSSLSGIALAFLPFQDRPLTLWIAAFFKSIYSPTIYTWKKTSPEDTAFFQNGAQKKEESASPSPFAQKLEEEEKNFLSRISSFFTLNKKGDNTKDNEQTKTQKETEIKIPETKPVAFKTTLPPQSATPEPTPTPSLQEIKISPLVGEKLKQKPTPPFYSQKAALPTSPSQPNTVSGQTLDPDGKILEGVILEIRDFAGRPVRALKTNKLGHFVTVTPLPNGTYEIIAEKEGFDFSPIQFEAKGEIVPPIIIRAKKRTSLVVESQNENTANF